MGDKQRARMVNNVLRPRDGATNIEAGWTLFYDFDLTKLLSDGSVNIAFASQNEEVKLEKINSLAKKRFWL